MSYLYFCIYLAAALFAVLSLSYLFSGKDAVFGRKFWNPFFMDFVIFFSFLIWLIVAFCLESNPESNMTGLALIVLTCLAGSFVASLVLRLNLKQRIKRQRYQIKLVPAQFGNMSMAQMKVMFKRYVDS